MVYSLISFLVSLKVRYYLKINSFNIGIFLVQCPNCFFQIMNLTIFIYSFILLSINSFTKVVNLDESGSSKRIFKVMQFPFCHENLAINHLLIALPRLSMLMNRGLSKTIYLRVHFQSNAVSFLSRKTCNQSSLNLFLYLRGFWLVVKDFESNNSQLVEQILGTILILYLFLSHAFQRCLS